MIYRGRLLQTPYKLSPSWVEPFIIVLQGDLEYSVKLPNGKVVNRVHPRYLKPHSESVLKEESVTKTVSNNKEQTQISDLTDPTSPIVSLDLLDSFNSEINPTVIPESPSTLPTKQGQRRPRKQV